MNTAQGAKLVNHILMSKKWFIENDEFDTGARQLLNFGHTYGHALEAATKFAIPHGIAISLGMKAAIEFKSQSIVKKEKILVEGIDKILFPVKKEIDKWSTNFDPDLFKNAFAGDKKHTSNTFRQILSVNGQLEVVEEARTEALLSKALESMQVVLRQ